MTGSVEIGALERLGVLTGSRQGTKAAAGSTQTDAATLPAIVSIITAASGTNGVILPKTRQQGRQVEVYSSAATNALLIYPPVGGTINNAAVNTAFSATARIPYIFMCISPDGLNWIAK